MAKFLPTAPVEKLTRPLTRFLRIESAGGIVLFVATVVALALANSPWAAVYHHFWHTPVAVEIGGFRLAGEFGHLVVNDGFMTIFFFVVGLEIKREMVAGELRDPRKAALPVAAALGGMIVPAGIYAALRWGEPDFRGWGVPMATDIAFVVGAMTLLGRRVPSGLKVMLLSLAIADDIGAVVVIAAFYSGSLHLGMLLLAVGGLVAAAVLNRLGVRSVLVYVLLGAAVWLALFRSGVHPTVGGVVFGLLTPCGEWVGRDGLRLALLDVAARLAEGSEEGVRDEELQLLAFAAREAVSPLERLEHLLHPWVGFVVMPLFALANAGLEVRLAEVRNPVAAAIALGLVVGKPVGVVLFSWLAVQFGVARLPSDVGWRVLAGGGCLAGIGFTMSLFVAGLAFEDTPEHLAAAKLGVLAGSVVSAVVGAAMLMKLDSSKPLAG